MLVTYFIYFICEEDFYLDVQILLLLNPPWSFRAVL